MAEKQHLFNERDMRGMTKLAGVDVPGIMTEDVLTNEKNVSHVADAFARFLAGDPNSAIDNLEQLKGQEIIFSKDGTFNTPENVGILHGLLFKKIEAAIVEAAKEAEERIYGDRK